MAEWDYMGIFIMDKEVFYNFVFLYALLAVLHQEFLWHVCMLSSATLVLFISLILLVLKIFLFLLFFFFIIIFFINSLNIAKHILICSKVIVIILIEK